MRLFTALSTALLFATAAFADSHIIDKPSPHDVPTTLDRLEQAVEDAGATVIARVDHSGVAVDAGMELQPTALVIFGNPEMGTPLMQENQQIGLEVPLRVAAYEDADGQVHLIYEDMAAMAATYGVAGDSEAVTNVSAALEMLTDQAIADE